MNKEVHIQKEGMALFSVLAVMVLLLIMSLAIFTLTTGNMRSSAVVTSRLQALNLANAASLYSVYELEENFTEPATLWGPGPTPTSAPVSFVEYPYSDISSKLNNLPGTYKVAYADNLNNTQSVTVSPPSIFSSYITSPVNVSPETAVVIAQGEYGGFKRTIKTTYKFTYYGSVADGTITYDGGELILNGVGDLVSLTPYSGSVYAVSGIECKNLTGYKIYNGSKLVSSGSVISSGGVTVPSEYIENSTPAKPPVADWNLSDPNVTKGDPTTFSTVFPSSGIEANLCSTVIRPSFKPLACPAPIIADNQRWYVNTGGVIFGNTFVNGSYHVKGVGLQIQGGKCLVVNGTLQIDGYLYMLPNSTLIVTGYSGDSGADYGLSLDVQKEDLYYIWSLMDGASPMLGNSAIFTEGDIRIKALNSPDYPGKIVNPSDDVPATNWLAISPTDIDKVVATFNMLGITSDYANIVNGWYNSGTGGNIVSIPGYTGKQILQGAANAELLNKGLRPVPLEVSNWFNNVNADAGFRWENTSLCPWPGDTFNRHPGLYQSAYDVFLSSVIYTYGSLTTAGTTNPVRIVGGVVAKKRSGFSPQDTTDPNTSHGGNVTLTNGSSIVLHPGSYRSGKNIILPILTQFSWEELY